MNDRPGQAKLSSPELDARGSYLAAVISYCTAPRVSKSAKSAFGSKTIISTLSGFIPLFKFLIFLVVVLAPFLTPVHAAGSKGDMGSSGGGYGIACFDTELDANSASTLLVASQPLTAKLKQSIKRLVTLDYWEWENQHSSPLIDVANAESFQDVVKRVQSNVKKAAPFFAFRLQQVARRIHFQSWAPTSHLENASDAHPSQPLPPECRLVPLATRYSSGNNLAGMGPVRVCLRFRLSMIIVSDQHAHRILDSSIN